MGRAHVLIVASALAAFGHFAGRAAVAAPAVPADEARNASAVRQMMLAIPPELARQGPLGWLRYFDDDRHFLMAVDGKLQFDGIASATTFLQSFAKGISRIELTWADIKVDPLGPGIASIAATWREVLTDTQGHANRAQGYFTAVAIQTPAGWKLRAVHWSSLPETKPGG
jgi:hypothetical protein